jgi:hypothetical protein
MIIDTTSVVSIEELEGKYSWQELQKSATSTTNHNVANKIESMVQKHMDRIWDNNSVLEQLT